MKRFDAMNTVLVVIFLCITCFAFAQEAEKGPRLVLEKQEFDFGEVKEGTEISHEFKVLNRGDSALVIKRVSPG